MNKLKVYFIPIKKNMMGNSIVKQPYYLKTEADKVITELKKERDWLAKDRAQAYDDLEKRAQLNIKQEESIRHHKYKRCLAMAKWCLFWKNYWHCCEPTDLGAFIARERFFSKWQKRWLKIAEKFKEAK